MPKVKKVKVPRSGTKVVKNKLSKHAGELDRLFNLGQPEKLNTQRHIPSPHLIDLKKIKYEQHLAQETKKQFLPQWQSKIASEFTKRAEKIESSFSAFGQGKKHLTAHVNHSHATKHQPINYPAQTLIRNISLEPQKEKNKQRNWPKISFPTFHLPSFNFKLPSLPQLPTLRFSELYINNNAFKGIIIFLIFSLTMTSPLLAYNYYSQVQDQKEQIISSTDAALSNLLNGKNLLMENNLTGAAQSLNFAVNYFSTSKESISNLPLTLGVLTNFLGQNQLKTVGLVLDGAEKVSLMAKEATIILNDRNEDNLFNKISKLIILLEKNQETINSLSDNIRLINPDLVPDNNREAVLAAKNFVGAFGQSFNGLLSGSKLLLEILGQTQQQRYLIAFQNNNELRPTGGFIGSMAEVEIDQGKLTKINVPAAGPYSLRPNRGVEIEPPAPISALNYRWEFQDANYFPDLPTSGKKLSWFYENSGGVSTDGIIFINATLAQTLFKLTGPIYLDEFDLEVNENNFFEVLQNETEFGELKKLNMPKKIIGDLLPIFIERIIGASKNSLADLITIIEQALAEKEIQIYLNNPQWQSEISNRMWSGEQLNTSGDYLEIVSTNIAGGKSNLNLRDSIDIITSINEDGTVTNRITLTREHLGDPADPLGGVKNNDYIRFYVPQGSKLIKAVGFEPIPTDAYRFAGFPQEKDELLSSINQTKIIDPDSQTESYQENGYTVFANWLQVSPQEKKSIELVYTLPFALINPEKDSSTYSLLLQKQSGKPHQRYHQFIYAPDNLKFRWSYPSGIEMEGNKYSFAIEELKTDKIIGIVFDHEKTQ